MLEPARLQFTPDGTPWSETYADVYHSSHGGPAQARHVFLGGNGLPERWQTRERFLILETGFGLGLNFLSTWAAWRAAAGACRQLHFVSIEKHPFALADLRCAQAAWPEFAGLAAELQAHWPLQVPGIHRLRLDHGRVLLTLVWGDASRQLRQLMLAADAFYLDGFSPARNPELWSPELCRALARLAAPGATLATWSVAGALRQALAANEFELEKRPGFARKRQMLVGRYRSRKPHPSPTPPPALRQALVLGAGIAGCSIAAELAGRGWQVELLERGNVGQGASGNLAGVLRPLPSVDDNPLARLTRAGFLASRARLLALDAAGLPLRWGQTGALQLARDAEHEALQARTVARLGLPAEFVQYLDATAASARAAWPLARGGWYFPLGGWVQPSSLCHALLQSQQAEQQASQAKQSGQLRLREHCPVHSIVRQGELWLACDARGHCLAAAPHLVVAAGVDATRLLPLAWLPQRPARGQVTHLRAASFLPREDDTPGPAPDLLLCGASYLTPAVDGWRLAGASFSMDDPDPSLRPQDHAANLAGLEALLPGIGARLNAASGHANLLANSGETTSGRVGFRPMSPDRLPIVGAVPDPSSRARGRHIPAQPGLWCLQGFGARGIVWSALMADLLASRMNGDPLPLEYDLVQHLTPERFLRAGK